MKIKKIDVYLCNNFFFVFYVEDVKIKKFDVYLCNNFFVSYVEDVNIKKKLFGNFFIFLYSMALHEGTRRRKQLLRYIIICDIFFVLIRQRRKRKKKNLYIHVKYFVISSFNFRKCVFNFVPDHLKCANARFNFVFDR